MRNVDFAHSQELVGFDRSFMVNFVGKLQFFVHFPLRHIEDVPHSLVTAHDGLVFLDQTLYSFQHECVQIRRLDDLEKRMGPQQICGRQLLSGEVIIFYLPDIVFNGDPHLEVEQLIHSSLLVVLLQQLKLVIEQSDGYLVGLDLLHYLREAVLYLRVEIGLSELLVMHCFLGKSHQDLFFKGKLPGFFLALLDAFGVGGDEVVERVDALVDLSEGIVIDYWKLSEPKDNGEEDGALFL